MEYYSNVDECTRCGIDMPKSKLTQWGVDWLCPDCMEMICPSFDEERNKVETTEAYQQMKQRYLGRKVRGVRGEVKRIDIDIYGRDFVHYYMDIAVDYDGYITDVSRLEAILLPDPHAPYETGRLYPIQDEDYTTTVDVIFQDDITFEDA